MGNPVDALADDLEGAVERLVALPQVVGVQLATVSPAGVGVAAAGPADLEAPSVAVTAATPFRPGSITKLLTATLVLRCVDEGLVRLDEPVVRHLPELRLAEPGQAEAIRVAHLLSHSSGIDAADLFVDTGDGDDAVAAYVALLAGRGLLFEPGRWMSYCNAGYVLAGHLVARLRGTTWEDAVRACVLEPLGMASTSLLSGAQAEGVGARGHLVGFGGPAPVPAGTLAADPMCTRGLGPAGATLTSTAGDLAHLAAAHLGVAGAPQVLSPASAARMRDLWAPAPGGVTGMAGMGLSWQVWPTSPVPVRIGGANPGQSALVALEPASGTALVALTNSDRGVGAVTALLDGAGPPVRPDDEPAPDDLSPYAGTYRSHAMDLTVSVGDDGGLVVAASGIEEARIGAVRLPGAVGDLSSPLTPVDRTTFASMLGPFAFYDPDADGRPRLLRFSMRAHRRVR